MRFRTASEMALRMVFKRTMGRRLETGPLGLPGFANGMRVPGPNIDDKSSPLVTLVLTILVIIGATSSAAYFRSSPGVSSGPHAFLFFSRRNAASTSRLLSGLMSFCGEGLGTGSVTVTELNC